MDLRNRFAIAVFGVAIATISIALAGAARADKLPGGPEACVPGAAGAPIGSVVARTGKPWAESEDCDAAAGRALTCGEAIYAGEHVITDSEASIAFTIAGSEVHVAPNSELRVALGPDGAADVEVLRGRVRVVDPEDSTGVGRRLASGDLVSIGRGDTELSAIAGQPAMICEFAAPLTIGGSLLTPGECTGPNFAAHAAAGIGVSLADAGRCDVADYDAFDPFDVAAGPGLAPFPPPGVPPPPPPSCAFGTCTASPPVNPPPTAPPDVVESPGVDEPPPP